MSTSEICNIFAGITPSLVGFYPANNIPLIKDNSKAILNIDEADSPGTHWVALFVNNQTCELFYSLGRNPENYHSYWS